LGRRASRARLIYASSSLLYPLHFDPRLVDDHYVGVLTGKRPDVIVCDPFLRGGQRTIAQRRPHDFTLIERRLAEYRLVFETGGYQVLFSPEFASTATPEGRMPY
jgi:hypothetical protein